jgi:Holliday junction resolvase RusA-like endonuclease
MNQVSFTVYGDPKGKARPKFAKIGNHMQSYQSTEQINTESYIKMAYLEAAAGAYLTGALAMKVTAYFQIPKSVSKKKRDEMLSGEIRPTVKPDADNILKSIADSLNKVAYDDDKQIVSCIFDKFYSDRARMEITIENK